MQKESRALTHEERLELIMRPIIINTIVPQQSHGNYGTQNHSLADTALLMTPKYGPGANGSSSGK